MFKRVVIILSVILLLLVGGFIWLHVFINDKIQTGIEQINEGADSLYVGHYEYSIWSRYFSADSIYLDIDARSRRVNGRIVRIDIKDIDLWSIWRSDTIQVGFGGLRGADIQLLPSKLSDSTIVDSKKPNKKSIQFRGLNIQVSQINNTDENGFEKWLAKGIRLQQGSICFPEMNQVIGESDWQVDSFTLFGEKKDFIFLSMHLQSYLDLFTVNSFQMRPHTNYAKAFTGDQRASSWVALRMDSLRTSSERFTKNINQKKVLLDSISIGSLAIEVYDNDGQQALRDRSKPMPIEAIRKLPIPIKINQVAVSHVHIVYGLFSENQDVGKITFSNGNLNVQNVDNQSDVGSTKLQYAGTFDELSPLQLQLNFGLDGDGRRWEARAKMGRYELVQINPMLATGAGILIKSGIVNSLHFTMYANGNIAKGDMQLMYEDLKIKKVRGKTAWLQNFFKGFVVKKKNTKSKKWRIGQMYYEHNPERSFFNMFWQSILSGLRSSILSTVAVPQELEAKKRKSKKKKAK